MNIAFLPPEPALSRFVAPWDACGWYAACEQLSSGDLAYTNANVRFLSIPPEYEGADYIRMFDSCAQGFDDKQEVCFHTECETILGIAFDPDAFHPDWLNDYTLSGLYLTTTLGKWPIYERHCSADEVVTIPGFAGNGHHYLPLIRPLAAPKSSPIPFSAWPSSSMAVCPQKHYSNYITECFLTEEALTGYRTSACSILPECGVRIGGFLTCDVNAAGNRLVFEASFRACGHRGGELRFTANAGQTLLRFPLDQTAVPGDDPLCLRIIFDSEKASAEIWINSRRRGQSLRLSSNALPSRLCFSARVSPLLLDSFSVSDDTQEYVVNDSMERVPQRFQALSGSISRMPFPFHDRGSLLIKNPEGIAAGIYRFPAMDRPFTFEVKLRGEGNGYCEVPVMLDDRGVPLLRIALYKNNLFVSDGSQWKRMACGTTNWQYYPCRNWMLLRLQIDPVRGIYSLWADGALRAKDYALTHAVQSICAVGFLCAEPEGLYIQRIRIVDDLDFTRSLLPAAPVMDVFDFGAIGDGHSMDTFALQAAVDAAAAVSGTVLLHDGTFLTGEIQLRSHITFWIDRSAVLLGSQNHADYPLHEPGTSLCAVRQLGRGLLYGENIHHVRITGGGMMDGNGLYRFKENDPVNNRQPLSRPCMIYIAYSSDITIESISMRRSCFWTLVPLSCRNVTLRHLNLDCMYTPNRDGIDPVDVCDMSIYDCAIMAGDDGLCFKSSDAMGCERIHVSDMMIQSLASGIKFGTDTYYSFRDAIVKDCTLKNVNRCGVSLEAVDGAQIENVRFEAIDMVDVGAPAYVVTGCRNRVPRGGSPSRVSYIRNVLFRHLRFEQAYPFSFSPWLREIMVVGQSREQAICGVRFEHCFFSLPGGCHNPAKVPNVIDRHYPEYDQHGPSAGSVFTTRFTQGFSATDIFAEFSKPDSRETIVSFDMV